MEEKENPRKVYWETQLHLVILLKQIGIYFAPNQRITPFRTQEMVRRSAADESVKEAIYQAIADLVSLRTQGLEPPHKAGFYL